MSDRYNFLTVALAKDTRDDDAEDIINAIGMIKGVLAVEPNIADATTWTAECRIKQEYADKVLEIFRN